LCQEALDIGIYALPVVEAIVES